MPSVGHMPTCYRFGGFPREGSMRPGTVSLFGGGWEAGMWVCFLLGCCLPFEGIVKWSVGVLSSEKAALEVEAVLKQSLPQPWWGPCQWLHTAAGSPPISKPRAGRACHPVCACLFFFCLGLAWMDHTDRLEVTLANASRSISLRLWILRGLKHLPLWCLGSVTTSPDHLGLSPGPFHSFHLCSLWDAPNPLNGKYLVMGNTQDQIKGWGITTMLSIN